MSEFVTQIKCVYCHRSLRSNKPMQIGVDMAVCPRCGGKFRVEAPEGSENRRHAAGSAPAPEVDRFATYKNEAASKAAARPYIPPSAPAKAPTLPPMAVPEIPGYTILGELGRGGMGLVYKARHEKLKRIVALKVIVIDPAEASTHFLANMQDEAEAVARLHHPNVVQIYEVGEYNHNTFLALEYVTGGNLKTRIDGQPQPIRATAQLVETVARAVHAAHQRGIVHRDLKPANILLEFSIHDHDHDTTVSQHIEAEQLYGVPKVADFGVAKRMDETGTHRIGELVGTPAYMAPEQAKGQADDIGPASDVYAIGVILYEMLTGRPPFQGASAVEVLSKTIHDAPEPPRSIRPVVPRDLEAVCLRCLEKDPRVRYRSTLALAEDLHRFLDGEPVRARPAHLPAKAWRWSLRNPVPAALLLTSAVLVAVGPASLYRVSESMVDQAALEAAAQQTSTLREVNKLYTEVAAQAKKGGVEVTHKFPEEDKTSIPIPARFTILLGERLERQIDEDTEGKSQGHGFMRLQMYSKYPFRERPNSPPKHKFGKDALKHYEESEDKTGPYSKFDKYSGVKVLRYATPMIMVKRCLSCHNDKETFPNLAKTDWKEGDVRGVLEIVVPLEESLDQTRATLFNTYSLLGGAAVTSLALSWGIFKVGSRRQT